jgi:hypothetical protein
MNENAKPDRSGVLRRLVVAFAACGTLAVPVAFAHPEGNLDLVPPAELPESARQAGEAMLLQDVGANTFLYIEQDHGARITVLDVTDPSRIRSAGSVQLDAPAAFDFVAPAGYQRELVRFREGSGEAVLDLHKPTVPSLKTVQGLTLAGPVTDLGAGGFTVASDTAAEGDVGRDYQVVDTALFGGVAQVIEVKDVREELTRRDTGTTFLLTDEGLYLIRQPAVERWKMRQDLENLSP